MTADIHANWERLIAPFQPALAERPREPARSYGDLDMLQIGPWETNRRKQCFARPPVAGRAIPPNHPVVPADPAALCHIPVWMPLT